MLRKIVTESLHRDFHGRGRSFRHDLIYQTTVDCLSGGNIAATHHQTQRFGHASLAAAPMQLAHQTLRTAVAGQQVQIDFRLAKLRVLCCDDIGAGQNQFVTATQCGAIDRRDHRFAELLQCSKCSLCGVWCCTCRLEITCLAYLQQFFHVGTGNKGTAGAGDHHGIHVVLMLELLHNSV